MSSNDSTETETETDTEASNDDHRDTERTKVETYLPAYQKEIWIDEADELEMSQSEFVKTMVDRGMEAFDALDENDETGTDSGGTLTDLDETVLDWLEQVDHLVHETMVALLREDVEIAADAALDNLQSEGRVVVQKGKFALAEELGSECPNCGHDNGHRANYCSECGRGLGGGL